MRPWAISLFINLFVCYFSNGQTVTINSALAKAACNMKTAPTSMASPNRFADTSNRSNLYGTPYTFMASNYYTSTLGFFCKKEIQIEMALKLPVKFRLGSVAYTDKMEGKGAAIFLPEGKR